MANSIRATLLEMWRRVITVDKSKDGEVYWNGYNNLYPTEVDAVVGNSPTAAMASRVMAMFLKGEGLVNEADDIIVNAEKNYRVSNIIGMIANDVPVQGGSWIFVGRDALLNPTNIDVLNYDFARKAKEDDLGFDGKIFYKDWSKTDGRFSRQKKETEWFYPFSRDKAVILAQIKNDYELKKGEITSDIEIADMLPYYRGQVYYLNTTPKYVYAKSYVDAVYNDADTEYRISLYLNGQVRSGFMGKTSIITQGLDDNDKDKIEKEISEWMGSENSASVHYMNVPIGTNIDEVLKIQQYKAQIDPKLFDTLLPALRDNILGAFCSIPKTLVLSGDNAMFSAGEGALIEAKRFYNQQTFDLRWQIAEAMQRIGFKCEIKEISTNDATTKTNI